MAKAQYPVQTNFKARDRVSPTVKNMRKNVVSFSKETQKQFGAMNRRSSILAKSFRTVATGFGIGSGIALFQKLGQAAKSSFMIGVDFEQSMANAVAKFSDGITKTSEAYQKLEDVTRKVGRETVFTANEAAQGLELLAMAGLNVEQAISALPRTVNLAIAAKLDLARATEISLKTLGQFNLRTKDTVQLSKNLTRINDVLAKSSNKANLTMENMFETFQMSAPVMASMGASLETAATFTAVLADAGIEGSRAGTTLKNAYLKLINPVGKGEKTIKSLQLRVEDSNGDMRDMVDIFEDLGKKLEGFGTRKRGKILDILFGKRAIAGSNVVLFRGIKNIRKFREEIINSAGASKTMADIIQDTIGGALKRLNSVARSVVLSLFEINKSRFREIIEGLTKIVFKIDTWIVANKELIDKQLQGIVDLGKEIIKNFDIEKVKSFFKESKEGASDFLKLLNLILETTNKIIKVSTFAAKATQTLKDPIATAKATRDFLFNNEDFVRKFFASGSVPSTGGAPSLAGSPATRDVKRFIEERAVESGEKDTESIININFKNKPDDVDIETDIATTNINLSGGKTR